MRHFNIRSAIIGTLGLGSFAFADPPQIEFEAINLKLEPFGYSIESTDFEADPNRQIVVTLTAKKEIVDIRGRYSTKKSIEEWSIYYHEGSPALAQLKKWKKISSIEEEEIGEALVKVETFLAKDGKFETTSEDAEKRIVEMRSFAKTKQAEQSGTEPASATDLKPEGSQKPRSESKVHSD